MIKQHRLLKRQLKKANLSEHIIHQLEPFLEQVNDAYNAFDNDLAHIENILEKSSQELFLTNQQLKSNVEQISSQLSKVAGNIQDVIFEIDLDGNWSYLNSAWEKFTSFKVSQSLGKPYHEFLKDKNGNPLENLIDLKNPNFKKLKKTFESCTQNGELKWFDITLKAVKTDEDTLEGYIGNITDVSSQKKAELDLIEAKTKETQANKAKDDFLSTMSHEIRTPLNAVIGVSHLLLIEDPKEEQLENLDALKYSSEHLLSLVNDILDYNKISSNSLEIEEVDFSLEHLLNGLHSIFLNKAKEKNIGFSITKDKLLPKMLIGDSTRLMQVLTNLINNAIKFTETGSVTLDIKLKNETQHSYFLSFNVIDTGIGIAENKIDKIFMSFAQASSDTARKYGGTGLGLAICKNLIELMKSNLTVSSTVDKGSTFSFELELQKSIITNFYKEEFNHNNSNKKTANTLKGIKILVAEDNKLNTLVIKKFLTKWNTDFEIVENGLIAVEKAKTNHYDLILMDLQMPELNGYLASMTIRKSNKLIPIYALSASTGADIKNKIKVHGIDGLISKPFNPNDLYKTLSKIVQKSLISL